MALTDVYYNDKSLRNIGGILNTITPMPRAERRMDTHEVPGRSGHLHVFHDTYNSVERVLEVTARSMDAVRAINDWAVPSGRLRATNDPGYFYSVFQSANIQWEQRSPTIYTASIAFDAEPYRYYDMGDESVTITESKTLVNPGNHYSLPLLEVVATGNITLYVNNTGMVVQGVTGTYTIDSLMQAIVKDGNAIQYVLRGQFPKLVPGVNTFSWAGPVTSVKIIPRWRSV